MKNLVTLAVLVILGGGLIYSGGYWTLQPVTEESAQESKTEESETKGTTKVTESPTSTKTDSKKEEDFGGYEYVCEGGVEFTMRPNAQVTSITLTPGKNAQFSELVLAEKESSGGARFEGAGAMFRGAGEDVQLRIGETLLNCSPKPNPDMAPFNWGDAGEGGGAQQPDMGLIVSESILGKWQSTEDTKFTREFQSGGVAIDMYDNESTTSAMWKIFTKDTAPEVSFPLESGAAYLQLTTPGSADGTLYFKVATLTPEVLELVNMDGGILRFTQVH